MHGHASRLGDGQHVVVFVQNREFARRGGRSFLLGGALGLTHGRQTHQIPRFHPGVCRRPAFVHPHLAAADDAVNMGLGHAFELADQKVVQALPGRLFVHFDQAGRDRCGLDLGSNFALYNVFH